VTNEALPPLPCGFDPNNGDETAHWESGCIHCAVEYVRSQAPLLYAEAEPILRAFDETENGVFVFACNTQLLAKDAAILVAEIDRLRAELAKVKP